MKFALCFLVAVGFFATATNSLCNPIPNKPQKAKNAQKIVGLWKLKSEAVNSSSSVQIEFTKDLVCTMTIKGMNGDKELKVTGNYEFLEENQIKIELEGQSEDHDPVVMIDRLTEEVLILIEKDKSGKIKQQNEFIRGNSDENREKKEPKKDKKAER